MKKESNASHPVVSIGIPVMPERERYIDECLESVTKQTFSLPYEVIIAEHPGFNYRLKIGPVSPNISIRKVSSGESLSQKRNDIIEASRGEYIVNIDDDVVPHNNWLETMILSARENEYDIFWGAASYQFDVH